MMTPRQLERIGKQLFGGACPTCGQPAKGTWQQRLAGALEVDPSTIYRQLRLARVPKVTELAVLMLGTVLAPTKRAKGR